MRALRSRLLRWSRHKCRTLPAETLVQYDLPCRCGFHITGVLFADTESEALLGMGFPIRRQDMNGPVMALLNHYDACPSRRS